MVLDQISRRKLIAFLGGATAGPFAARAQRVISAAASGTIAHGSQLIGQGQPGCNVGPTALLGATGYPGSLFVPKLPSMGYFRDDDLPSWAIRTPYVYNNDPSNHGGIVPSGGMVVDGYNIPGGTYVAQFWDVTAASREIFYFLTAGKNFLIRGCRYRKGGAGTAGFLNCQPGFTGKTYVFFSDIGGTGAGPGQVLETCIDPANGSGVTAYRNFLSYIGTAIQPNLNGAEATENWIEKLSLWPSTLHLNGITLNGGTDSVLLLRNHIVIASHDDAGRLINQTDCISFFQDFGTFPGTGTNGDGTVGYQVINNYVGGTGYCFYAGLNSGAAPSTVHNMVMTGNTITTQIFPSGGFFGPCGAQPQWGNNGNVSSNNTWADGPNAGKRAF